MHISSSSQMLAVPSLPSIFSHISLFMSFNPEFCAFYLTVFIYLFFFYLVSQILCLLTPESPRASVSFVTHVTGRLLRAPLSHLFPFLHSSLGIITHVNHFLCSNITAASELSLIPYVNGPTFCGLFCSTWNLLFCQTFFNLVLVFIKSCVAGVTFFIAF